MVYTDPFTKEQFYPKRLNQKFASRANQIKFNNRKAQKKRIAHHKAQRALNRNWEICKRLLGDKNEVIKSKDWLEALEYNFHYCTHFEDCEGDVYPATHEFILITLPDNKYKIVRNNAY